MVPRKKARIKSNKQPCDLAGCLRLGISWGRIGLYVTGGGWLPMKNEKWRSACRAKFKQWYGQYSPLVPVANTTTTF
jgi:hypothetical protein